MQAIAYVLQLIMQPCYDLTGNWWLTILLFTLITKVILLPLSLWCQWNSIVMVKLMPELNRLKVKYFGDRETIGEQQNALYKEKHYHPLLSLIPLAVQILILFGLVDVIHSITDNGAPGTEILGMVPTIDGGISWIMPVLAGLSAVALGYAQNRINPLQREQSRAEKNMTNGLSIGLSLVLALFVATGMAFYWIISNLSAILVQVICNLIINPKKYIDYPDLRASQAELAELTELGKSDRKWYQRDPLKKREKEDFKRFFNIENKHIMFYSESSGFYKYFRGAIEWLLENCDVTIHYVTNDPNDQIFELAKQHPRIKPYYIGVQKAITLLMKLDCDVMVSSLDEFDNYYLKRSYVRKDIEYVYMPHAIQSQYLTGTKHSVDNFDTILATGQHLITEMQRAEELYGLKKKHYVEYGFDLLDKDAEAFEAMERAAGAGETDTGMSAGADEAASADASANEADTGANEAGSGEGVSAKRRPTVLIAPSWQEDCILDLCIDNMIEPLLGKGYQIIVRPHPEYTKRYKPRWEALQARWAHVPAEELYFEHDFSSNETVFMADAMATDWSTIGSEYSFATGKPTLFIETPMKIRNADYQELGLVPTDISWRSEIGISVPVDSLANFDQVVADVIEHHSEWRERIFAFRDQNVFNFGHAGEAAGKYLLSQMVKAQVRKAPKE